MGAASAPMAMAAAQAAKQNPAEQQHAERLPVADVRHAGKGVGQQAVPQLHDDPGDGGDTGDGHHADFDAAGDAA